MWWYRNLGSRDVNYPSPAGTGVLCYQFGRVAPHPGGPDNGTSGYLGTTKVAYHPSNYVRSTTSTIRVGISSPLTYYIGTTAWNSEVTAVDYAWNDIKVGTTADAKSIFDPSPAGWRVPIHGVLASFSTSTVARVWTGTIGGTYRSVAYYPANGYRVNTTALMAAVGTQGLSWFSTPSSTTTGYFLVFYASAVNPSFSHARPRGCPVRPISER